MKRYRKSNTHLITTFTDTTFKILSSQSVLIKGVVSVQDRVPVQDRVTAHCPYTTKWHPLSFHFRDWPTA